MPAGADGLLCAGYGPALGSGSSSSSSGSWPRGWNPVWQQPGRVGVPGTWGGPDPAAAVEWQWELGARPGSGLGSGRPPLPPEAGEAAGAWGSQLPLQRAFSGSTEPFTDKPGPPAAAAAMMAMVIWVWLLAVVVACRQMAAAVAVVQWAVCQAAAGQMVLQAAVQQLMRDLLMRQQLMMSGVSGEDRLA